MTNIIYQGNVTITIGDKKYYFHNNGTQAFFNNIAEALAGVSPLLIPTYVQFIKVDNGVNKNLSYQSPITSLRVDTTSTIESLKLAAQVSFKETTDIASSTLQLLGTSGAVTAPVVLAEVTIGELSTQISPSQQLLVEWELTFGNSSNTQEVNK